jgi:hypothetical protein
VCAWWMAACRDGELLICRGGEFLMSCMCRGGELLMSCMRVKWNVYDGASKWMMDWKKSKQ